MKLSKVLAGLLVAFLLVAPNPVLGQGAFYFWWQVVDELDRPYTGQTVRCSVYDLLTVHSQLLFGREKVLHYEAQMADAGTTQPLLSDANGRLHFYSSISTDVRVNCFSAYGGQGRARLSRGVHKIIIPRGFGNKVARFEFKTNTGTTRTGLWLPVGTVIRDVIVYNAAPVNDEGNNTVAAHLNVGFVGDHVVADMGRLDNHQKSAFVHSFGLLAFGSRTGAYGSDISGVAKQWFRPGVHITAGGGAAGSAPGGSSPAITGSHRGAALAYMHTAGNLVGVGADGRGGLGLYFEQSYMVNSPNGIEVTYSTSSNTDIKGHVYLMFDLYHVDAVGSGISN